MCAQCSAGAQLIKERVCGQKGIKCQSIYSLVHIVDGLGVELR